MRSPKLLAVVALGVAALATAPGAEAAAPVGLIKEIPMNSNVVDITAGPEGDLWFTENLGKRGIGKISPAGKVTRFKQLPVAVEPTDLVTGSDGNVWFTYNRGGGGFSGGGIGRITPAGKVSLFPEPPELHGSPFEIVAGPDGNLWFDHAAILTPTGQAIGRITTAGVISEFDTGLNARAAVTNLTAGTDGNVWFADESFAPAIGRVTPSGEITEFPGLAPEEYPIIYGPTPAPGGSLYFSANEAHRIAVERISPAGQITRFRRGLNRHTVRVGPFTIGRAGDPWFRVERNLPGGQTARPDGTAAIAHMTPAGKITEFSRCLRPLPGFAGPEELTPGPEGNIWFNTRTSGAAGHAGASSTPAIGRITPAGKITEFRYGLDDESEPSQLTFAGGRLWFLDRRTEAIGEITPPRRAPNTFLVSFPQEHRRVQIEVIVPGGGTVRIEETGVISGRHRTVVPGLITKVVKAPACGPISLPLPFAPQLQRLLDHRRELRLTLNVTFRPRGGAPFTRSTAISVVPG